MVEELTVLGIIIGIIIGGAFALFYAMLYSRSTLSRLFGWMMFFVLVILLVRMIQDKPRGEGVAEAKANEIVYDLRNAKSAIQLAISDDGRLPRTYIYDNAAYNEKFGRYMDRPLREQVCAFVIVLDDLKTGDVFVGFIASQSKSEMMNDKDVRLKLAGRAQDAGLRQNISGEFYDGGGIIMMRVGIYPALKEGAASGDLPLER